MKIKLYDVFVLRELVILGDYETHKIRAEVLSKCTLSPEELEKRGVLVDVNGKVGFNEKEKEKIDIEFTKKELEVIKNKLIKLDKDEKLRTDTISLYELFVK